MTKLSVRAFANNRGLNVAGGIRSAMQAAGQPGVWGWLSTDRPAAEIWWLNQSATRVLDNGPDGARMTIVVVGDGFAESEQAAYNSAVDTLLTGAGGMFTQDYFVTNRSAFNVIRVNLTSVDAGVSTKSYATTPPTTVERDTALHAYFNGDWNNCWVEDSADTAGRLEQALAIWAPEHGIICVLLNNPGFGGCAWVPRMTLPLGVSWSTVAHELGHTLGLGDEYCGTKAYTGGEPGYPNLTVNTARSTLKWGGHVAASTALPTASGACATFSSTNPRPVGWVDNTSVGLFEGGNGSHNTGIYRPVLSCRMNTNNPPFCPVCEDSVDTQVLPHLPSVVAGPPVSVRGEDPAMPEGYVRMVVRYSGGQLSIVAARALPGPLVQPSTVTHGLVHEVRLGGRRVALGSMPGAGVSRSFTEPGHGPREHHIQEYDTFDFVVRVPQAELRGADLAELSVTVVSVQETRQEPLSGAAIADQPGVRAVPVASLEGVRSTEAPEALRRATEA